MKLDCIAAAAAAAWFCAAWPAPGTAGDVSSTWVPAPSCTAETQTCRDRLTARLRGEAVDPTRIVEVLIELYATDPDCALLLLGTDWARR